MPSRLPTLDIGRIYGSVKRLCYGRRTDCAMHVKCDSNRPDHRCILRRL